MKALIYILTFLAAIHSSFSHFSCEEVGAAMGEFVDGSYKDHPECCDTNVCLCSQCPQAQLWYPSLNRLIIQLNQSKIRLYNLVRYVYWAIERPWKPPRVFS